MNDLHVCLSLNKSLASCTLLPSSLRSWSSHCWSIVSFACLCFCCLLYFRVTGIVCPYSFVPRPRITPVAVHEVFTPGPLPGIHIITGTSLINPLSRPWIDAPVSLLSFLRLFDLYVAPCYGNLQIDFYTSAHGSGRRYYILLLQFFSFFFFFRHRISEMALSTGNLSSSDGRIYKVFQKKRTPNLFL